MEKRIMVVEDSRITELLLEDLLEGSEYKVVSYCRDGEEALVRYREIRPDIVTMDILMPGMDGLETAQAILEEYPEARIVMASSLAYDDTISEARAIGTRAFIYKPFEREQILEAFAEAMRDDEERP